MQEYYDELVGTDTDTSRFLKAIGVKMKQNASSVDYETFVWDQVAAAVLIDKNVVTSYEDVVRLSDVRVCLLWGDITHNTHN